MSLTVGAFLLGFVVVTAALFARARPPHMELSFGLTLIVLLFARGPEPAQTYLFIAAYAVGVLLLVLALKSVPRQNLSRIRGELLLFSGLMVALVLSAFVVPDTRAAQMPLLVLIVMLGAALIIRVATRLTILYVRAWRQPPKSA